MSQKDSGFKPKPVLNALRSAAVMALPPKAANADEMDEGEDRADDAVEVSRSRVNSLPWTSTCSSLVQLLR